MKSLQAAITDYGISPQELDEAIVNRIFKCRSYNFH